MLTSSRSGTVKAKDNKHRSTKCQLKYVRTWARNLCVCVCVCVTENKYFKFDMYTYIRYVYVRFSADITFY